MKTLTKITVAAALAIAAAAPAFAKDSKHTQNDGTRAQASVPYTQPAFDPAMLVGDYGN